MLAREKIAVSAGRADLADDFRFRGKPEATPVWILEEDGLALGWDNAIATLIVEQPDRHVRCTGRIADVDRIVEKRGGASRRANFALYAIEAITAQTGRFHNLLLSSYMSIRFNRGR